MIKNVYEYSGPVYEFEECISQHWEGRTYAISEKKARSNLTYQYKKNHNRTADSNIRLTGSIRLIG